MARQQQAHPHIHAVQADAAPSAPFGRTREEIELAAEGMCLPLLETDHWRVLQFIRAYYLHTGRTPVLARVGRATGLSLRELFRLFPDGPIQTVMRLTGLDGPLDPSGRCPLASN